MLELLAFYQTNVRIKISDPFRDKVCDLVQVLFVGKHNRC